MNHHATVHRWVPRSLVVGMIVATLAAVALLLVTANMRSGVVVLGGCLGAFFFLGFVVSVLMRGGRHFARLCFYIILILNAALNALEEIFTFPIAGLEGFWLRVVLDAAVLVVAVVTLVTTTWHQKDKGTYLAYALFVGWVTFVAIAFSPWQSGLPAVLRFSVPLAFYVLATGLLENERDVRWAIAAIIGSSLIPLMFAAYQWLTGVAYYMNYVYRLTGTYTIHPVFFSLYLLIVLFTLYAVGLPIVGKKWPLRILEAVLFTCLGIALLLTYTRASWVGFVVGLVGLSFLAERRSLTVAIIAIGLAVPLLSPEFVQRVLRATEEYYLWLMRGQEYGPVAFRLALHEQIYSRALESPILGHGFGSFAAFVDRIWKMGKVAPHDDFLYLFFETGLVGLVFYLNCLRAATRNARLYMRGRSFISRVAQTSLVSCLVINILLFTHNAIFATDIQGYIFALLGCTSVLVGTRERGTRAAKAGSPSLMAIRMESGRI